MIELKRLKLINWHNFENVTFDCARFVAQDVDAQVADRQVFDQLCEVAVIALRRLVTLIDGG